MEGFTVRAVRHETVTVDDFRPEPYLGPPARDVLPVTPTRDSPSLSLTRSDVTPSGTNRRTPRSLSVWESLGDGFPSRLPLYTVTLS